MSYFNAAIGLVLGLFFQLLPAVLLGLGIIFYAYEYLEQTDLDRSRLVTDAVKDFGVVVVGIAIVEIVWAALGGSPVDRSLTTLNNTTSDLKGKLHDEVVAISQQFTATRDQFGADVSRMILQFNADVKGISQLVDGGARTGLGNIGESQDFLAYQPAIFITDVLKAS